MTRFSLLLASFVACSRPAVTPTPPDTEVVDSQVDTDPSETDPPTDTETDLHSDPDTAVLASLTAVITPPQPGWRDDLLCEVSGLPAGETATINWTVNGHAFTSSAASQVWPGDVVAHLEQASGQSWTCTVTTGTGDQATSALVTIDGPTTLITLPPATVTLPWIVIRIPNVTTTYPPNTLTFTRPLLLGAYETTQAEWTAQGFALPRMATLDDWRGLIAQDPTHPIYFMTADDTLRFLNTLSEQDGVPPCYPCTSAGCELEVSVVACEGYRLPTPAEFTYAYTELGTHMDQFPAGGNLPDDYAFGQYDYPEPLVGPNVGSSATAADQCVYGYGATLGLASSPGANGRYPARVGSRIPNAAGFYDLCGNVGELVHGDKYSPTAVDPEDPDEDPYATNRGAIHQGASSQVPIFNDIRLGSEVVGFRIARSLTPAPLPPPTP
jgi:formylglycine-generating enzyme required for sulfatase activity